MITFYDFDVPAPAGLSFVGSASATGVSSNYSVDLSGLAIQQNDIVVVAAGHSSNGTSQASITCSGNNSLAYTVNTSESEGGDTFDTSFRVFYKVMGATPDTTLDMTNAGTSACGAVVHVWRGIDPVSPIDTTGTASKGTNTGRGDPPAITPTNAGAIIIACGIGSQPPGAGSAFTVPTGMSNGVSIHRAGGFSDTGVWMTSDVWVSGGYNPAAWTGGSDSTNCSWIGQTIALKPA